VTNTENPIARFSRKYQGHLLHLVAEEYLGFLFSHLPGMEGILLRRVVYRRLFKKLGKSSLIYSGVHLTHTYGIEAGDFLSINTGALLDGRGGIDIGSGVMIGPNTVIVSSAHQFDIPDAPMTSLDHVMKPVSIMDDVWIGAQAFIKGGLTIGTGAVIGAGAVVLDNVPEHAVVGGNPGRVLKIRQKTSKVF
jgi:maltose O-acetyltransferase